MAQQGFCQLEKGTFLVGGVINLGFSDTEYESTTSYVSTAKIFDFNFSPDVSYMITDRFSIGVLFPIGYQKMKFSYNAVGFTYNDQVEFNYSVGTQLRYYFPFDNWAFFPRVTYSIGKSNVIRDDFEPITGVLVEDAKFEGKVNQLSAGFGLSYFIATNIGLEGIIAYSLDKFRYEDFDRFRGNRDVSDIQLSVGLQFYLRNEM